MRKALSAQLNGAFFMPFFGTFKGKLIDYLNLRLINKKAPVLKTEAFKEGILEYRREVHF